MKHTGCLHFITLMNLLHLPTSVNCPQDIISHIQVVHRLQVKSYPISLSFNQSLVAKIKKHFNQSTMSLLFYVILFLYNLFALVIALIRVHKH